MNILAKMVTIASLSFTGFAMAESKILIPLQPGSSYKIDSVPTGYSFNVTCQNADPAVVVPQPPEAQKEYRCTAKWNGGPADGVKGILSSDKCEAVRSAIRVCFSRFSDRNFAAAFCTTTSRHYGSGVTCKDGSGNAVNTNDCI